MPDEEARVLSAAAAHDSTIASTEDQAGRSNKELPATARVSMSIAQVVDRRSVEPAGDTGWSVLAISTNFGDGGIQRS